MMGRQKNFKDPMLLRVTNTYIVFCVGVAVVERAQKRVSTSDEGGVPAKAEKLTPPSVRNKLLTRSHLVNLRFFHDWWNRRSVKPILRQ